MLRLGTEVAFCAVLRGGGWLRLGAAALAWAFGKARGCSAKAEAAQQH